MSNSARQTLGAFWIVIWIGSFIALSLWYSLNGDFYEVWRRLFLFFRETEIMPHTLWGNRDILMGFILFDLWIGIGIGCLLAIIIRPSHDTDLSWLNLSFPSLLCRLVFGAAGEEILFRFLPFVFFFYVVGLIPSLGTNLSLWAVILSSSAIFAFVHIFNQKTENRKIILVLPQFVGGILLSYIFLSFGLFGSIIVHFAFNFYLLIGPWVGERIRPLSTHT